MRGVIEEIERRLAAYRARSVEPVGPLKAAVLLALYERDGVLHVVLTKRTDRVEMHKGEISFPGGACELDDADCEATALREAEEEIGLAPGDVRVIGRLDEAITISHFHVTPYVGVIDVARSPYAWRPQEREVAEVLEVPLGHLLDASCLVDFPVEREGRTEMRQGYKFGEHVIWGATGRMLANFLEAAVTPETAEEASSEVAGA
jgi:8-oxo-dGTP pyrophosphatase MutT (NUDIX family)